MNSNSVFAETKKERQLKELAFLSILYFCVTVAIVTLMTLIYDVISTGYSRLFNDYRVKDKFSLFFIFLLLIAIIPPLAKGSCFKL